MGSYFCTHVSRLLDFDTDDVISFDIKYFFISYNLFTTDSLYSQKKKYIYIYIYTKNNNKCRHLPTFNN